MTDPISDIALDRLFRTARTYNGYTEEPVGEVQLRAIYELVKMGPTSANCQPLRIYWLTTAEAKERLAQFASSTNGSKIRKAPVTAILAYDTHFYEYLPRFFPHTDARSWFTSSPEFAQTTAFRNGSLQGAYFIMAARAIGLDTGPMSGFDNEKVDAEFFAGTTYKSNFISTLGHGDPASIFERLPRPEFEEFNKIL